MDTIRNEFSYLNNHVVEGRTTIPIEIQDLSQKQLRLKDANAKVHTQHLDPVEVPVPNAKEQKINMTEKFDGTKSKFRSFMQQVKLFLRLHSSRYLDNMTQVGFVGTLLSGIGFVSFTPLMEKN